MVNNMTPDAPLIMGVVNATPDSFSDAGTYDPIAHARKLIEDGADVLDIGGESTRPGANPVSKDQELSRIIPVIEALAQGGVTISVDTHKPDVAKAAFAAGAKVWNDVSALSGEGALEMAAHLGGEVILMHKLGDPQTMQDAPQYVDVVSEVEAYLLMRAEAAMKAGVRREHIWIDPGIGFGKTLDHNLALLRATKRLSGHGFPLLMAASNKRFIADLEVRHDTPPSPANERLGGTISAHLFALQKGASMVRVHDVAAMKQALNIWQSLK